MTGKFPWKEKHRVVAICIQGSKEIVVILRKQSKVGLMILTAISMKLVCDKNLYLKGTRRTLFMPWHQLFAHVVNYSTYYREKLINMLR